ncbi:hypothetical protein HanRHA438_Chr12g0562231 [Helianthus annuus]|nr:hypothetical protein HanRHA438_Chr12g0562231 [Helianthus annuus]
MTILKMKVEVGDGGTGRRSHAGDDVIGGDYVQVRYGDFELAVIGREIFFRQFDDDDATMTVEGRFFTCNPAFAAMSNGNFEPNPRVFQYPTHDF